VSVIDAIVTQKELMILLDHVIPQVLAVVKLGLKEINVTTAKITTMVETVRNVNVTLMVAPIRYVTKIMANVLASKNIKG